MIGLNETAAFLWELLEEERTVEELASLLYNEYDISEEKALETVNRFGALLEKEGVLADA